MNKERLYARLYVAIGEKGLENVYGRTAVDSKIICITKEPIKEHKEHKENVIYFTEEDSQSIINQNIYNVFYPRIPDDSEWMLSQDDDEIQQDYEYYYKRIYDTKEYLMSYKILVNTNRYVSPKWTFNFLKNLQYLTAFPPVRVCAGKGSGKPVVIVSAGCSLDEDIERLRSVEKNVIIIALGTTLKPLLHYGIIPDFCIGIDASERHYQHFDSDNVRENSKKIILVADLMICPRILKEWQGKMLIMDSCTSDIKEWFYKYIGNVGTLSSGYSVATTAFSLALLLYASPIIFMGQDLCLGEKGRSHARFTTWDGLTSSVGATLPWIGNSGNRVKTIPVFISVIRWLEESFKVVHEAYKDMEIINTSMMGAKIEGMTVLPFSDAIKKYAVESIDKTWINSLFDFKYDHEKIFFMLNEFKKQYHEIENLEKLSKQALKHTKKRIDDMRESGEVRTPSFHLMEMIKKKELSLPWLSPWFSEMRLFLNKDLNRYEDRIYYQESLLKLYRHEMYLIGLQRCCETVLPLLENALPKEKVNL